MVDLKSSKINCFVCSANEILKTRCVSIGCIVGKNKTKKKQQQKKKKKKTTDFM